MINAPPDIRAWRLRRSCLVVLLTRSSLVDEVDALAARPHRPGHLGRTKPPAIVIKEGLCDGLPLAPSNRCRLWL
jgi:hypothetical protein